MDLESPPAQVFFGTTFLPGILVLQYLLLPELFGHSASSSNNKNEQTKQQDTRSPHHELLLRERMMHYPYIFALTALVIYYSLNPTLFRYLRWGWFLSMLLVIQLVQQGFHEYNDLVISSSNEDATTHHYLQEELLSELRWVNVVCDSVGVILFGAYAVVGMKGYRYLLMGRFLAEPMMVFGTLLNLFWQTHLKFVHSCYHFYYHTPLEGLTILLQDEDVHKEDLLSSSLTSTMMDWISFTLRVLGTIMLWSLYGLFYLGFRKHHERRATELRQHWKTKWSSPKMKMV